MDDPHVVALHYVVEPATSVQFDNPPPVRFHGREFEGTLVDGHAVTRMTEHFSSAEDARVPVDAYLRAWEIASGVDNGRTEFRFRYNRAEIIDRTPALPGQIRANSSATFGITVSGAAVTMKLTRRNYPLPPADFAASPLVEMLWRRLEGHLLGQEPLFSMCYFCLTAVERSVGGREEASKFYAIDKRVLGTIAQLSSSRGSPADARKIVTNGIPATEKELVWLAASVRALIKQVAIVHSGTTPPQLGMSALPPLAPG